MAITDLPFGWPDYTAIQQGWQCPACLRVYAPSVMMCHYCPPKRAAGTCKGDEGAVIVTAGDPPGTIGGGISVSSNVRTGYGTRCPTPREGGTCGCDEDDEPKVCLSSECDC